MAREHVAVRRALARGLRNKLMVACPLCGRDQAFNCERPPEPVMHLVKLVQLVAPLAGAQAGAQPAVV